MKFCNFRFSLVAIVTMVCSLLTTDSMAQNFDAKELLKEYEAAKEEVYKHVREGDFASALKHQKRATNQFLENANQSALRNRRNALMPVEDLAVLYLANKDLKNAQGVFDLIAASPLESGGRTVWTARKKAYKTIEVAFQKDPENLARSMRIWLEICVDRYDFQWKQDKISEWRQRRVAWCEQRIKILESLVGPDHLFVADSFAMKGHAVFHGGGNFLSGAKGLERANDIYLKEYGGFVEQLAEIQCDIGRSYWRGNDMEKAAIWLKRAADNTQKHFGNSSSNNWKYQLFAGKILFNTGRFSLARSYMLRSLDSTKKKYGAASAETARALHNLSMVNLLFRDSKSATKSAIESHSILSNLEPNYSTAIELARAKYQLVECLMKDGQLTEARSVISDYHTLVSKHDLTSRDFQIHNQYVLMLKNSSLIELADGKLEAAKHQIRLAEKEYVLANKKSKVVDKLLEAKIPLTKARIAIAEKKFKLAAQLLEGIQKSGNLDRGFASARRMANVQLLLGYCYQMVEEGDKARQCYLSSLETFDVGIEGMSFALNSNELVHINKFSRLVLSNLAQATDFKDSDEVERFYGYATRFKGLSSRIIQSQAKLISERGTNEPKLFARFLKVKSRYDELLLLSSMGKKNALSELRATEYEMTHLIGKLLGDVRIGSVVDKVDAFELCRQLSEDSLVLDFIELFDPERVLQTEPLREQQIDGNMLVFAISSKDGQIEISTVKLPSSSTTADQVANYLAIFKRDSNTRDLKRKKRRTNGAKNAELAQRFLTNQVWKKLEPVVGNQKTIVFCPEGAFARIPWSAIRNSDGQHLIQQDFAILRATNLRAAVNGLTSNVELKTGSFLGIGGVNYGRCPESKDMAAWNVLSHSVEEIQQLGTFARPTITNSKILGGEKVLKSTLVNELSKANIVQVATHSYTPHDLNFLSGQKLTQEQTEELEILTSHHPFSSVGLVLSNANPGIAKAKRKDCLSDDSSESVLSEHFLSGRDLLYQDLSQIKLFILSACNSAGGELAAGEGVFGLQTALHLAGVRNSIASHWDVDDRATKELMLLFNKNLFENGLPIGVALKKAQVEMMKRQEFSEVDWGAWSVMIGN